MLHPARLMVAGFHIDAMCEHLEAVSAGQIKRLIINVPPGCMKSLTVAVMWPTWEWTWAPDKSYLTASYSERLSTRDAVRSRRLIQSEWYQERWGGVFQMTGDQNQKTRYENDQSGFRVASSVGGTITGERADRRILDDPHKVEEAHSDTVRESTIEWLDETWANRGTDVDSVEVVIMQRLHERDATGHLLKEIGGYEHLVLPMRYEPQRACVTAIGWQDPRTEEGELLCPARFPLEEVDRLEKRLGSYGTAGQHQQRPAPAGGGIVQRAWIKFYTPETVPEYFDVVIQSWDMSFKKTEGGSFVAGQVWGKRGANLYLLDRVKRRMGFVETVKAVERMTLDWPEARLKLIEDKANGPAVIDELKAKVGGLIPVQVEGSKEARMHAVTPEIEAGNVHLPHPDTALWVNEFLDNLEVFPNGASNDDGDAMSQALNRLVKMNRATSGSRLTAEDNNASHRRAAFAGFRGASL